MSAFYAELRPAYTGEESYSVTITVEGAGSIAGQEFSATLLKPDGTTASGSATAEILDADDRTVLVTLPGQTAPGEYLWECRRTDNDSNLLVAHGVVDVQRTGGRGTT